MKVIGRINNLTERHDQMILIAESFGDEQIIRALVKIMTCPEAQMVVRDGNGKETRFSFERSDNEGGA